MQSHAINVIDDVIAKMCENITYNINTSSVMFGVTAMTVMRTIAI